MKACPLSLFLFTSLLASCTNVADGPYRHYKVSSVEAIPASQVGGAPYRQHR